MAQYPQRHDGITVYGLPANPALGTIAVDSADGKLKRWSGSAWVSTESTGGSTTLAALTDVNVTPQDKQVLQYDSASGKWINSTLTINNQAVVMTQNADSATLTDFTNVNGEIVSSPAPVIHGTKSFRLIHQAGSTRSMKQTVVLDKDFRNHQLTFSMALISSALSANVTLLVTDETNSTSLLSSQVTTGSQSITATTNTSTSLTGLSTTDFNKLFVGQTITGAGIATGTTITTLTASTLSATLSIAATASATITAKVSDRAQIQSFSFTPPDNCTTISYTVSALAEAGLPETYFDDISIVLAARSLSSASIVTQTTDTQSLQIVQTASFGAATITGAATSSNGSGIYSYDSVTGIYTALRTARVSVTASLNSSTTNYVEAAIIKNTTVMAYGSSVASANFRTNASANFEVVAGDTWKVTNNNAVTSNQQWITVLASASTNTTQTIPLTSSILQTQPDAYLRIKDFTATLASSATHVISLLTGQSIKENIGNAIQYLDDSVNGARFIAQYDGVYDFEVSFNSGTGSYIFTKNSANLTVAVASVPSSEVLNVSYNPGTGITWMKTTVYLKVGDIVRIHSDSNGTANYQGFAASYRGSTKIINPSSDQKIAIPTHLLRFEGASTKGSTDTGIVKFDTQTITQGDGFTVVNTVANGTVITVRKAGRLTVAASLLGASSNQVQITKNQTVLTNTSSVSSEIMHSSYVATSARLPLNATFDVIAGDVIRIAATLSVTADVSNVMILSLQEQSVAIALQNVSPTFIDAGSNVHVAQANGKGSTNTPIRRFANVIQNIGGDVTYTDSAALGGSFLINTTDFYVISFSDQSTGSVANYFGLSKNSSQLTTDFNSLTDGSGLTQAQVAASNDYGASAWAGYLTKGDVIRLHGTAANMVSTNIGNARTHLSILRIGKPSLTSVDVSPFVNFPQMMVTQYIKLTGGTAGSPTTNYTVATNTNTGILSAYNTTTGYFTALKKCVVSATVVGNGAGTNLGANIYVNGAIIVSQSNASAGQGEHASVTVELNVGDTIAAGNTGTNSNSAFITAIALTDSVATPTQQVSSDTMNFNFKATAIDPTTDPIGTFNTYTYAINSNTPTISASAPTQTTASMNTNGIQVFARAYNAASTTASPARVDIFIGKGLKSKQVDAYGALAKASPFIYDKMVVNTGSEFGTSVYYNEVTGILVIEAAVNQLTTGTNRQVGTDSSLNVYGNGYFVFNASKIPSLAAFPNQNLRIAYLQDVKTNGSGGGTPVAATWNTRTLNTLTDPTGFVTSLAANQFILAAGTYDFYGQAQAWVSGVSKLRIRNITDGTTSLVGEKGYGASGAQAVSNLIGQVTLATAKLFELQHYVGTATGGAQGFGVNDASTENDIFAQLRIIKIK